MNKDEKEEPDKSESHEPHRNGALTYKQINYARELIEERRKLEDTPIEKVWPFLKYCCCCLLKKRKRAFKAGLKAALRKKLGMKFRRSEQQIEDDPFMLLGYGLNSYFSVVLQLMVMMGLIHLLSLPLMMTYASYDDLQ